MATSVFRATAEDSVSAKAPAKVEISQLSSFSNFTNANFNPTTMLSMHSPMPAHMSKSYGEVDHTITMQPPKVPPRMCDHPSANAPTPKDLPMFSYPSEKTNVTGQSKGQSNPKKLAPRRRDKALAKARQASKDAEAFPDEMIDYAQLSAQFPYMWPTPDFIGVDAPAMPYCDPWIMAHAQSLYNPFANYFEFEPSHTVQTDSCDKSEDGSTTEHARSVSNDSTSVGKATSEEGSEDEGIQVLTLDHDIGAVAGKQILAMLHYSHDIGEAQSTNDAGLVTLDAIAPPGLCALPMDYKPPGLTMVADSAAILSGPPPGLTAAVVYQVALPPLPPGLEFLCSPPGLELSADEVADATPKTSQLNEFPDDTPSTVADESDLRFAETVIDASEPIPALVESPTNDDEDDNGDWSAWLLDAAIAASLKTGQQQGMPVAVIDEQVPSEECAAAVKASKGPNAAAPEPTVPSAKGDTKVLPVSAAPAAKLAKPTPKAQLAKPEQKTKPAQVTLKKAEAPMLKPPTPMPTPTVLLAKLELPSQPAKTEMKVQPVKTEAKASPMKTELKIQSVKPGPKAQPVKTELKAHLAKTEGKTEPAQPELKRQPVRTEPKIVSAKAELKAQTTKSEAKVQQLKLAAEMERVQPALAQSEIKAEPPLSHAVRKNDVLYINHYGFLALLGLIVLAVCTILTPASRSRHSSTQADSSPYNSARLTDVTGKVLQGLPDSSHAWGTVFPHDMPKYGRERSIVSSMKSMEVDIARAQVAGFNIKTKLSMAAQATTSSTRTQTPPRSKSQHRRMR